MNIDNYLNSVIATCFEIGGIMSLILATFMSSNSNAQFSIWGLDSRTCSYIFAIIGSLMLLYKNYFYVYEREV